METIARQPSGPPTAEGGRVYLDFGRGTIVAQKRLTATWAMDRTAFARFGPGTITLYAEPDGVVWLGRADNRFVRFDTEPRAGRRAGDVFRPDHARHSHNDRLLFGGGAAESGPLQLDAASNALRIEFAAPGYVDECDHPVPVAGSTASRPTGRRGPAKPGATSPTWASATTASASAPAASPAPSATRPSTRSRSCRPGIARGWPTAATSRCWPASPSSLATALQAPPRRGPGSGSARALRKRSCAPSAAEALARSESEGKKNVELLGEIGREITSSLDFDTIFGKLYERVNQLADADVFGVGLYHPERHEIEYRLAIEKGKRYAPYSRDDARTTTSCRSGASNTASRSSSTTCRAEYRRYITRYDETAGRSKTARCRSEPQSIIYLPLIAKEQVLGIITIQSFEKHAYTEHHLNVLQSLASYTAIALDNANAYRQLNEHEVEIRRLFEEAQQARAIAEEADAAKSAFLSTVSHELRTPLTSVLGFAKIIKKRLEDRIFPLVPKDDPQGRLDHPAGRGQPEGRRQRGRAAHQADRRRARSRQDRGGQARMAHGERDDGRDHRPRHGRHLVAVRSEGPAAGEAGRAGSSGGHRRPGSPDPGGHQPDLERGEVHRRGHDHLPRRRGAAASWSSASSTPAWASRRRISRRCSSASSRSATR